MCTMRTIGSSSVSSVDTQRLSIADALELDHPSERGSVGELVASHSELVNRIAHNLIVRMPRSVDVKDLMQSGMVGLIEASRSFDASQGASFETHATSRIRGAMLDELRKGDWVPRSVHRRLRSLAEATRAVEQNSGRPAKSNEVAALMNLPIDDFEKLLTDAARGHVLSIDAYAAREDQAQVGGEDGGTFEFADQSKSPADLLDDREFRCELVHTINNLPEREKQVLSLHYKEELNLSEIGYVLAVSNSRICQMHAQAMVRVRTHMRGWNDLADADIRFSSPKGPQQRAQ
jgi:RNA polymerase sigma factor for flagellar operon FliA